MPPLVQKLAIDQQHLAPLRAKARVAVRIVNGNAQSQCRATAYGGYGAAASATRERRKPTQNQQQADTAPAESPVVQRLSAKTHQLGGAPASIALSSSTATTQRVYYNAVSSRAAEIQKNFGLLHTATSQKNSCVALAPLATLQENFCVALAPLATSFLFVIAQMQQFKERVTECTRRRTLASLAYGQIKGIARITSSSALNRT